MRLTLVLAAAAAAAVLAAGGDAAAYPQLQLSLGADTCRQCHVSPAGGGLLNDYGRDEAGSIARWELGDGRFLHGAWTPPASLQLGGDYRGALGAKADRIDGGWDPEGLAFPMQADLYLRPVVGAVSLNLTVGVRGAARGSDAPIAERLASREHYVMYEADGWYARAGRFFPVFGIRTQDHTAFVRRDLQMYVLEEPYGAAWGRYGDRDELHVSAFVRQPTPFLGAARDSGAAVYWERRNEEATAAYAAQARVTASETDRRAWLGGVYKRWLEPSRLMLLAELDLGVQAFPAPRAGSAAAAPDPRLQLVGYLGATYVALPGWLVGGVVQVHDPDLALGRTSRAAIEANVQWFPVPHVELHLLTRALAAGLDLDDPDLLVLLQLHYFL